VTALFIQFSFSRQNCSNILTLVPLSHRFL